MADVTALRQRILDRGERLTGDAARIMADRLLDAAGPTLRDGITLAGPTLAPPGRWQETISARPTLSAWVWRYGESAVPFEPHVALDGLEFDESDYTDVLDNGGAFTAKPYWFPGDHRGCNCTVEQVSGEIPFPGASSSSTIRTGGITITVERDRSVARAETVPAWWATTMTLEGWRSALEEAR